MTLLYFGRLGNELVALKLAADRLADVTAMIEAAQKLFQLEEFVIVRVVKPRFNGNAVINLVAKGVGGIVHQYRFG